MTRPRCFRKTAAEVSFQRPEIVLSREIAAGDFPDEKEVLLAEIGRELLDPAAEIAGLLDRDVLQGVDPEPSQSVSAIQYL